MTSAVNKTGEWLKKQIIRQRCLLLVLGKEVRALRQQFKQRQAIIINGRREKVEEDRQQKAQAEARQLKSQEHLTNQILYFGLWQSYEQVDNILSTSHNKE